MTDEERAACLEVGAKNMHATTADLEPWEEKTDSQKMVWRGIFAAGLNAWLHAAAGLPNSHKLVGKEATEEMQLASAKASVDQHYYKENAWERYVALECEQDWINGARFGWSAAHDAAPTWESGR